MKQINLISKGRTLLFMLCALFAGTSPAWADEYTCGFEADDGWTSQNENLKTVGDDWAYNNGALSYYDVRTSYGVSGQGLVCTGGNTEYYIFTPKVKAGTISLSAKRTTNSTSSSYRSYVYIYKCTKDESTGVYTVATSPSLNYNSNGDLVQSKFTSTSFELNEDSYLAIRLIRAGIDNFTASEGLATEDAGAIDKPTAFKVSSKTYNSATFSWTVGDKETAWQLVYSTEADFDKDAATPIDITENPYTLTGLAENTTYYAYLRAKSGEELSSWTKKVEFTTDVQFPAPTAFAMTSYTATTVTFGWTAGSTETAWEISYSTDPDFAADGGTKVAVTTNPYTLEGLTAETTYYAYLRANYGTGNSAWSERIQFATGAAPITVYPYTESFNSLSSGEIPAYWDNSEGTVTTDSRKWIYYGTGHDGACVRFDSYNNSSNLTNFLKTRPFKFLEGQAMKLTFMYKNPKGGDFSVYASTDGGVTYSTELETGLTGQTAWVEKEIDIPASIFGDNVVIVFKGTSNWGSGDAYIYLDDVTVSEKSTNAMSISGSDITENTIAFGTVKNSTTSKAFTIKNDGLSDLTNVSVVSSDETAFTVSETGFDIPTGESKEITVTFVKGVDGDYNETITVSQANIATPLNLNVTATYVTPTPATMDLTLSDVAVGDAVAFGTVGKATVKTFKVANSGEVALSATIAKTGEGADCFTLSTTALEVGAGAEETFTITFDATEFDVEKSATITLTAGDLNKSFTVTGTRGDFWIEDFEGGAIPAGWENSGFVVKNGSVGNYPTYPLTSYVAVGNGGSSEKTLITPLLKANAGDKLTFDGFFYYGDETMKVDYSTDLNEWNNLYTYDKTSYANGTTNNIEIESAITGEFYLRFTVNYYNGIDNIVGFKLAPAKEHDAAIASVNIPTTGNQYIEYTATATVKEKAGKTDEVVTAELWIGTTKVATEENVTLTANDDKEISLTFTPAEAMSGDAYVKVYNDNIELTSETTAVTINAALVLDENADVPELTQTTVASVVVKYTAEADAYNFICMPFELTTDIIEQLFGAGAKAYELKGYADNTLDYVSTTSFYAGYPYIVKANTPQANELKLQNVYIGRTTAQQDAYNSAISQGSFSSVAAGDLDGKYIVVDEQGLVAASEAIKGYRGYIELPAGITSALVSFDGETTGIVNSKRATVDNNQYYNLSGQRVNTPAKGLYIVNGTKVVIK